MRATQGDGTGGESIYGQTFQDESFTIKHDRAGLVSMANSGPNTNGSQFFVTLDEARHLDGRHVCFGRVTSGLSFVCVRSVLRYRVYVCAQSMAVYANAGFQVFKNMEKVPTGANDRPKKSCTIVNCGLLKVMTEEVSFFCCCPFRRHRVHR